MQLREQLMCAPGDVGVRESGGGGGGGRLGAQDGTRDGKEVQHPHGRL